MGYFVIRLELTIVQDILLLVLGLQLRCPAHETLIIRVMFLLQQTFYSVQGVPSYHPVHENR